MPLLVPGKDGGNLSSSSANERISRDIVEGRRNSSEDEESHLVGSGEEEPNTGTKGIRTRPIEIIVHLEGKHRDDHSPEVEDEEEFVLRSFKGKRILEYDSV